MRRLADGALAPNHGHAMTRPCPHEDEFQRTRFIGWGRFGRTHTRIGISRLRRVEVLSDETIRTRPLAVTAAPGTHPSQKSTRLTATLLHESTFSAATLGTTRSLPHRRTAVGLRLNKPVDPVDQQSAQISAGASTDNPCGVDHYERRPSTHFPFVGNRMFTPFGDDDPL